MSPATRRTNSSCVPANVGEHCGFATHSDMRLRKSPTTSFVHLTPCAVAALPAQSPTRAEILSVINARAERGETRRTETQLKNTTAPPSNTMQTSETMLMR